MSDNTSRVTPARQPVDVTRTHNNLSLAQDNENNHNDDDVDDDDDGNIII